VFLEARAWGHFGFVHLQLLDDDLLHLFFNSHARFSSCVQKTRGTLRDWKRTSAPCLPYRPAGEEDNHRAEKEAHGPEISSLLGEPGGVKASGCGEILQMQGNREQGAGDKENGRELHRP